MEEYQWKNMYLVSHRQNYVFTPKERESSNQIISIMVYTFHRSTMELRVPVYHSIGWEFADRNGSHMLVHGDEDVLKPRQFCAHPPLWSVSIVDGAFALGCSGAKNPSHSSLSISLFPSHSARHIA